MRSAEIRKRFLKFFEKQGHALIPSSPTVPLGDPTLLFTNAGMNQFKDVFLGLAKRDYTSATTAQKCLRVGGKHNDLDQVGHTARHMTFFEMLGNFSFGAYFKKEAIAYAWELTLNVYNFPKEKLWVTIFEDDDEAFEYWKAHISEKRILRFGEKDNFWSMGETGPCGPCTELFFDRGDMWGTAASPLEDTSGERYIEFWNLVFMQYTREKDGQLHPLPKPSVDTGSGLERVAMLHQDVATVFQTDILMHLIRTIETQHRCRYEPKVAPSFHVIADHLRSLSFAIADGAVPSNVDRGYVLRKILRRAVRYGRLIGIDKPFLGALIPTLVQAMEDDFIELKQSATRIQELLHVEEESFFKVLHRGGNILAGIIDKAKADPGKVISGEEAFKLKDTYGFPIEEILLIAKDNGLTVNLDAFELLEEKAKDLSRASRKTHAIQVQESLFHDFTAKYGTCEFTGYSTREGAGSIIALLHAGQFVDRLTAGEQGWVFLDATPFYAEKGGQVGDTGMIGHKNALFTVEDTLSPLTGVIAHVGTLKKGTLLLGEPVTATIDAKRRSLIENHHTATHLLHYALQQVLGPHIRQAGSLVSHDHLRFDFNHHKSLSPEELRRVEACVNGMIHENLSVATYELSFAEAQKRTDIKQFFGDKYGSHVRVVAIGPSKELCGGTHVNALGRIGLFRITKEGSIAKGVRRIEAAVGPFAENYMYAMEDLLHACVGHLGTTPGQLISHLDALIQENQALKKTVKTLEYKARSHEIQKLMDRKEKVGHAQAIIHHIELPPAMLAPFANELIACLPSGAVLLSTPSAPGECAVVIRATQDLVAKGFHAGQWLKEFSSLINGSGGGKADSAQGGGKNLSGLSQFQQQFKQRLAAL